MCSSSLVGLATLLAACGSSSKRSADRRRQSSVTRQRRRLVVPEDVQRGGDRRLPDANTDVTVTYNAGRLGPGQERPPDQDRRLRRHRQPAEARRARRRTRAARCSTSRPSRRRSRSRTTCPSVKKLQLSGTTLAKIFSLKIKKWNDAGDRRRQPRRDAALDRDHRRAPLRRLGHDDATSRSSSPPSTRPTGRSAAATRSTGPRSARRRAATKNAGVAQIVKSTDGAVGYVDLADATAAELQTASIKNKAGKFVAPTVDGAAAAVAERDVQARPLVRPDQRAGRRGLPDHLADVDHRVREADQATTRARR